MQTEQDRMDMGRQLDMSAEQEPYTRRGRASDPIGEDRDNAAAFRALEDLREREALAFGRHFTTMAARK